MISNIFHNFFYEPLYNSLVFLIDYLPGHDVGLAVIFLTILVKLLLFPLSYKAVKTQSKLKLVQAEIEKAKDKYKDNQEELAKQIMSIYRQHNLNPFAGFFTILIQLPILIALYLIFMRGGLPQINTDILYSFVMVPDDVNMHFLGIIDVSRKSVVAAILVGITQFFQARYAFPKSNTKSEAPLGSSFKDDFMKGMHIQLKYVFPVIMTAISFGLVAVVPMYWIVSNLFMIGQEIYMRKKGWKED